MIAKKSISLILAVFFIFTAGIVVSGMDNGDVIQMTKAGLSEDTIILAIRDDAQPKFDTSPANLIRLKEAGVSENIIQAMIGGSGGSDSGGGNSPGSNPASSFSSKDIASKKVMPAEASPTKGNTYYTRINIWHEGEKTLATNYSRGVLVPINTKVELTRIKRDEFTIKLESGESIRIINVPKYTQASMPEFLARYLAEKETKIELYGDEAAQQIRTGVLRLGMTKDQVLLTRGYPPIHETPSLESDRWVYWSSRFVKQTIVFTNGRLTEGRGLY